MPVARALCRPACLLALAAAVGCMPELNWREVRTVDPALRGLLPCRPDVHKRTLPLAGQPVSMTLQVCTADGITWGLAEVDLMDPARVGQALDELSAAAAVNLGTPAPQGTAFAPPGATPHPRARLVRIAGRMPDARSVVLELAVFSRGTRVFQASVLGAERAPLVSEPFFNGLRFDP